MRIRANTARQYTPTRGKISAIAVIAALPLAILTHSAAGDPLDDWIWRNPTPTAEDLQAVTYANGIYVAVGNLGTVFSSTNGTEWTKQTLPGTADQPTDNTLFSITYGAGQFVAAGERLPFYSTDGETWHRGRGPDNGISGVYGMAFGNGRFVIVGEEGMDPGYSDNGQDWSQSSWNWGTLGTPNLLAVAFGSGEFRAVGPYGQIFRSVNGKDWTHVNSGTGVTLFGIAYGNDHWVAVGDVGTILSSTNGIDWTAVPSPATNLLLNVTFSYGLFTAVGGEYYVGRERGVLLTSTDGGQWDLNPLSAPFMLSGTAAGPGGRVAVGYRGLIYHSPDAHNWQALGSAATHYDLRGITWARNQFVAVGRFTSAADTSGNITGSILTSPDGKSWTEVWHGDYNADLGGVCEGKGLIVAVGKKTSAGRGIVVVSSDGITWSRHDYDQEEAGFFNVAFGNGRFVAVGPHAAFCSDDGTNWLQAANGPSGTQLLWFVHGKFFAVSYYGTPGLRVSEDGITWGSAGMPDGISGIVWANGRFIATAFGVNGPGMGVFFSLNGTSWQKQSFSVTPALPPPSLNSGRDRISAELVADNQLIASGTFYQIDDYEGWETSAVYSSQDGTNWVRRFNQSTRGLARIAFGAGTLVAVGEGGAIVQSGTLPLSPITVGPVSVATNATLNLFGPVGRTCRVEYTDALGRAATWSLLKTVPIWESPFVVTDDNLTGIPNRFYRAVTLP
jgi:hypothetical protein